MKRLTPYLIVLVTIVGLAILIHFALGVTGDLANPPLGKVKYIWIGAVIVLAAIVAFFIWLFRKEARK